MQPWSGKYLGAVMHFYPTCTVLFDLFHMSSGARGGSANFMAGKNPLQSFGLPRSRRGGWAPSFSASAQHVAALSTGGSYRSLLSCEGDDIEFYCDVQSQLHLAESEWSRPPAEEPNSPRRFLHAPVCRYVAQRAMSLPQEEPAVASLQSVTLCWDHWTCKPHRCFQHLGFTGPLGL